MKTKITHICSITTWSSDKNQLQKIRDVEIMVEDDIIIDIADTLRDSLVTDSKSNKKNSNKTYS